MKMAKPIATLVVSAVALLLLPSTAAAAGLRIRDAAAPAAAKAAAPAPAAAPGPAPPAIRPGVVVRVTASKEQLLKNFVGLKIRYSSMMDEMLGKDFVVKTMANGGAGLASPNGSQDDTWYFPISALTPWTATHDAQKPPVARQAYKAVGLPTRARVEIAPPGRHDAPWDYNVKGKNLMDPIAPPFNERVDLEKTALPLPPWMKVKQVISVECMDKLHKDPNHLCDPKAYVNYNAVSTTKAPEKLLTKAEGDKLRLKIQQLEKNVKSLSPKAPEESKESKDAKAKKAALKFKAPGKSGALAPGMKKTDETMNTMGALNPPQGHENQKMEIGSKASNERLSTAGSHGEKPIM